MNGATSTHHLQAALEPRALNVEGGAAPEWIELIPAGATVLGVDRRSWANPDPQRFIDHTRAANRPIPLDWEHSTEVKAPRGEEAPAAGWVEELQLREGAVWGRVAWTPRAANQVANREYRYVSPVFTYAAAEPRPIGRLCSVALTNTPNLTLKALNRSAEVHAQEQAVNFQERVREALGLPAEAGEDAIIAAARESKAANKAGPDLTNYAPRSELLTAINRAETVEAKLAARDLADRDAAIEVALNKAQTEGKITPASRPEYLAMCKATGGLEQFVRLAATLPKITGDAATGAERKAVADGATTLTDEERAVCKALGQDETSFLAAKKEA